MLEIKAEVKMGQETGARLGLTVERAEFWDPRR